jgi:hypothetical protein
MKKVKNEVFGLIYSRTQYQVKNKIHDETYRKVYSQVCFFDQIRFETVNKIWIDLKW